MNLREDVFESVCDELPEDWRPATLDDFHEDGKLHVGMEYLQYSYYHDIWHLMKVKKGLKAKSFIYWINDEKIYVR